MADHDQRFKTLLQEFFAEFVQLFFPDWADRFDFSGLEWLNAEVFPDPPQGERRYLDLVAQLPTRQVVPAMRPGEDDAWIALLHVEIEWPDAVAPLRPRMFDYYWALRSRYRRPVLPIGLYLRVGLDGVGWDVFEESFWERRLVHFAVCVRRAAGAGRRALRGREQLAGRGPGGADADPGRAAGLAEGGGLAAADRLPGNPMRRFLLCEVVQAYLPLEGPQLEEFNHLLMTEKYMAGLKTQLTWAEEAELKAPAPGGERATRKEVRRTQPSESGAPEFHG